MGKVAIVGYTGSRGMAPYKDESWEIWGLNDLYKHIPRWTRWFQLHTWEMIDKHSQGNPNRDDAKKQKEAFNKMNGPVYLQKEDAEVKNSREYPLDEMLDHFGLMFKNKEEVKYFTNSISYMIALAIYEGFEEIHIYGVDMAVGTEFHDQRASCEFWVGVAAGRGIKVHVPDEADLLKSRFMYGFEEEKMHKFNVKMKAIEQELKVKVNNEAKQESSARDRKLQYMGAQMAHKEILRNWE